MAPQLRARTTRSQPRALANQDENTALGSLTPVEEVKRSDTSRQASASRGSVIADAGIDVENSATSSTTGKAKNTTKHRKRRGTRTVDRRTRLAARSKWRARLHTAECFTTYEPPANDDATTAALSREADKMAAVSESDDQTPGGHHSDDEDDSDDVQKSNDNDNDDSIDNNNNYDDNSQDDDDSDEDDASDGTLDHENTTSKVNSDSGTNNTAPKTYKGVPMSDMASGNFTPREVARPATCVRCGELYHVPTKPPPGKTVRELLEILNDYYEFEWGDFEGED